MSKHRPLSDAAYSKFFGENLLEEIFKLDEELEQLYESSKTEAQDLEEEFEREAHNLMESEIGRS